MNYKNYSTTSPFFWESTLSKAAPDLLEACESVIFGNVDCGTYWKVDAEDMDKVKKAISKAKGR